MYCSKCGTELKDESLFCPNCGKKMKGIKGSRIISYALIFIVVAAVAGTIGYRQYKYSQLKNKLADAVGKDTGYTETILKVEAESSHMTYKELFDLCDQSISQRTALIVELRGLYPELNYALKDELIEFLNSENELIRIKNSFYRNSLDFSTNLESYVEEVKDTPSSSYEWDYYIKSVASKKGDLIESISKIAESSDDFGSEYKRMFDLEAKLANSMDKANIRFIKVLEKYQDSNLKSIEDTKEAVESARKMLT